MTDFTPFVALVFGAFIMGLFIGIWVQARRGDVMADKEFKEKGLEGGH